MPASDVTKDILIPNSRILYVDPNDIYGKVNGVPITPDYSDFCIAFDLQCEIVARYKFGEIFGESKDGKFNIGFTRKVGVKGRYASLLQGEAYQDKNVLTTYYTDINYDNLVKETIVEGLGVESIDISFESYYCPNIKIKFVDHRGSALFGREEAIHYNDKLTIDNIFGAFFTIPYPKFKLQVKGFFGKAVTYQLSCTSFKGSLNSETGNFEAVATFIGYSYSLLTDIPFEYLVAAPYCKYVGEDYWKAHRGTPEWRLEYGSSNDDVPTIFDLLQRINAAFTNDNLLTAVTNDEQQILDSADDEIYCLNEINEYYIKFLNSIDDIVNEPSSKIRNYEPGTPVENAQILFMSKDTDFGEWIKPKTCWDDLIRTVEIYNEGFKDNKITEEILPTQPNFNNIQFTPYFVRAADGRGFVFKDVKETTTNNLVGKKINGNIITPSLAAAIIDFMNKAHSQTHILPNVYLLNCGDLSYVLENRTKELKTKITEINRNAERNYVHLALDSLGMVPYIGNIFKMILCHIETLIQMMAHCYENIMIAERVGQRTASYLGVNKITAEYNGLDDWSPITNIPPWPAVNKKDTGDTEYSDIEKNNTLGWVGDFSDNFEEAKLVRALYLACERTGKLPATMDAEEKVEFLYAPILPSDLNNDKNPFDRGEKNLSSLGGMLGIRAAQIFGIGEEAKISDDVAKALGVVDALNYYRFVGDKTLLSETIIEKTDDLATALYDIMLCKPSADKYCEKTDPSTGKQFHSFEWIYNLYEDVQRNPIYVEVNNVLNYCYLPNKSGYGIVPANTRDRNEYLTEQHKYIGSVDNRHYFNVDYLTDKTFLHYCTSKQLFEDYENPEKVSSYNNIEMYRVVTGTQHVSKILERYEQMRNHNIRVLGDTFKVDELDKILDRYWIVDKEERYHYMTNTGAFFCKPYKDCGIEDKMLLGSGFDKTVNTSDTLAKLRNLERANFTSGNKLTYSDGTEVDPNNAFICGVTCVIGNNIHSLFGINFYYMQNQIADTATRNHVKALLFLHTLFYNKDITMKWDAAQIKHSCISRIPFGLAALYGAFLWRHNYIMEHGEDPIKYGNSTEQIYKPAYIKDGVEYTLFEIYVGETWRLKPKLINDTNYTYPVFGNGKANALFVNKPDELVVTELIKTFETFIKNQWVTISKLELRKSDGTEFSDGKAFSDYVNNLTSKLLAAVETKDSESQELITAKADALESASKQFASFSTYYCYLWYYMHDANDKSIKYTDRMDLWLHPDNTEMQNALRSVYLGDCIELRSMCHALSEVSLAKKGKYTDIYVSIDNIKSYINGFVEQIKKIVDYTNNDMDIENVDMDISEETPEFNRETALPIYLYLKMLWDKWLVSLDMNDNEFMVKNFEKNFYFIDSFYRNIAHRFMLNCQLLLDCYNNNMTSNLDISAFKFIGDITTKHNCMFVSIPDFITNWAHQDCTKAAEALSSIFKPIPYSEMGPPSENNKFVVIYIPKLSENPSELNNFRDDGFNIWSYNEINKNDQTVDTRVEALPDIFHSVDIFNMETEGDLTRFGYYVPSFGLAYGRQNNHIFKNINLSMDAPVMTSAVINTLSHTARVGASSTHKVAFIGQDIYPVFSNYSYICEFEMMGCAQIQPLMYFQLMNVPMWRGTYIIFSVSHTMTPGNMVTRVRAMKLSCRVVPYSNAWFTENPKFDKEAYRRKMCLEDLANKGYTINAKNISTNNETNENDGEIQLNGFVFGGDINNKASVCKACYQAFIKAGATDAAAKGILANINHESGFVVDVLGWDGSVKSNKFGIGGGLGGFFYYGALPSLATSCGWTKAQLSALNDRVANCGLPYPKVPASSKNRKHIAKTVGKFPFTFEQQINYLVNLSYFKTVKSYTDPAKATKYWLDNFEKPTNKTDRWEKNKETILKYLQS